MTSPARLSALSFSKRLVMRLISDLYAQPFGDGEHVLVAAAAEIHHQQIVLRQSRRELGDMRQRMCRLECRDDALELAQELEGRERLVVGRRHVFNPALLLEP